MMGAITINLAPTANTVLDIYRETGTDPDVNYAIALLAYEQGYGHTTMDKLSATLNVEE